jgi:hypothetical protein
MWGILAKILYVIIIVMDNNQGFEHSFYQAAQQPINAPKKAKARKVPMRLIALVAAGVLMGLSVVAIMIMSVVKMDSGKKQVAVETKCDTEYEQRGNK